MFSATNNSLSPLLSLLTESYSISDQAGTENAEVRYLVVAGDPRGNFTINTKTGEIKPHDVFNYEKIPGTAQCKGLTLGAPASPHT